MNEFPQQPARESRDRLQSVCAWIESLPPCLPADLQKVRNQFDVNTLPNQMNFVLKLLAKALMERTNQISLANAACAKHLLKENLGIRNSNSIALLLIGENIPELKEKTWYKPTNFLKVTLEPLPN